MQQLLCMPSFALASGNRAVPSAPKGLIRTWACLMVCVTPPQTHQANEKAEESLTIFLHPFLSMADADGLAKCACQIDAMS